MSGVDANAHRVELLRPDDGGQLSALTAIYENAFPTAERKPASFLREVLARADYELYAVCGRHRRTGLAVVYRSIEHPFCLLEYMAIATEARGSGLGAALFKTVVERNAGRPILIEVEAAESGKEPENFVARRKAFYRRLGCRELAGVLYPMPPVASQLPPPMNLLVGGALERQIRKSVIETWVRDVFHNVYGIDDPDPVLHSFLGDKPEMIPLI